MRLDETIRHVRCVGTPVFDGDIFRRFVGTGIDVTDQEKAIVALRKGEEQLRQLADIASIHVSVIGSKRERIYANRVALAYLGITLDE